MNNLKLTNKLIISNKIKCLFALIKRRLIVIFHDRWLIETNGNSEWKNNMAHANILIQNISNFDIKTLSTKDKTAIEKGIIQDLSIPILSSILLNSKYKIIKQNEISIQNQIIISIIEANADTSNYTIKGVSQEMLDEIKDKPIIGIEEDKDIELLVNNLKESANKEHSSGNYLKAIEIYKSILEGYAYQLSFKTNSIIHSNLAISQIDFNGIRTFLEKNSKKSKSLSLPSTDDDNLILKSIYQVHMKMVKFNKLFSLFQQQQQSGKPTALENKLTIIKLLADSYRCYQLYYIVRMSKENEILVIELIDQLLVSCPGNIGVIICKLGLHRLDLERNHIDRGTHDFIKKTLLSIPKDSNDYSLLLYFQIIYSRYIPMQINNRGGSNEVGFDSLYKLSINNVKNILKSSLLSSSPVNQDLPSIINSYIAIDTFVYFALSILWSLEDNEICKKFKKEKTLFEFLMDCTNKFISRSPNENIQVAEIYLSIAFIKIKLKHKKESILEYYNKASEYRKSISPILNFTTVHYDHSLISLKQLLAIHFNDPNYLD